MTLMMKADKGFFMKQEKEKGKGKEKEVEIGTRMYSWARVMIRELIS